MLRRRLSTTAKQHYDVNSMSWVFTMLDKKRLKLTDEQIADIHGHSGFSWGWTCYQVNIIETKGIDYWMKTDGPKGFAHFLESRNAFK